MPLGAIVQPLRSSDTILWSIKFRNGTIKRFKFPIRTTPEGTAQPDGGFKTESEDLKSPLLATEPESLGLSELAKI